MSSSTSSEASSVTTSLDVSSNEGSSLDISKEGFSNCNNEEKEEDKTVKEKLTGEYKSYPGNTIWLCTLFVGLFWSEKNKCFYFFKIGLLHQSRYYYCFLVRSFRPIFSLFLYFQYGWWELKFANDWIRTVPLKRTKIFPIPQIFLSKFPCLSCRKQWFDQLSHNHFVKIKLKCKIIVVG